MAQKTSLGLSATPAANYNVSLFANKTQVEQVAVKGLDFMPFTFHHVTNMGLVLLRKRINFTYRN